MPDAKGVDSGGTKSAKSTQTDLDDSFACFLDGSPLPSWVVGGEDCAARVNRAWAEFTGTEATDQADEAWLESVLPEDRPALKHACTGALKAARSFDIEFQLRRADGQSRWMTCFASPQSSADGHVIGIVGMCMDLTDRRQREEQLAFMATHDSLTGLPNRRMFEGALQRAVERARRGDMSALLLIDLDNFKSYNDALGHLEGDQALINFSLLLQRHVRAGDLLARIGGDEFGVLLERTELLEGIDIAERMRQATSEGDFVSQARVHELGMSAGIVPVDGRLDARALFDLADEAMYEAKESGRNRVKALRPEDRTEADETERMAAKVREALSEHRFQLYYQPVVRLDGHGVAYYESLVRMIDSDGSLLMPREFLATVERLGLMPRLTRQIVSMLLTSLSDHPQAHVSMNISSGDLAEDSLPRFIEEEMRRRGVEPGRIVFELGESAVVTNIGAARYWIQRLRSIGCRFVLDEFGAGLGLFGLLRDLEFDQVKLDGSIVRELSANGESREFVTAVRTLVESQGCTAVASWVETEKLLKRVREAGFELGQGYELEMPDPDLGRLLVRYSAK